MSETKLEIAIERRIREWQGHMNKAKTSYEKQRCDVVLTILQNILKEGQEAPKASPVLSMMIDAYAPVTLPGEIRYWQAKQQAQEA